MGSGPVGAGHDGAAIAFRDYLRTHPDDAARCRTDRERYTDAKHEFVMEILDKALCVSQQCGPR